MSRFLFASFGSAGDVFPTFGTAHALQDLGHDVAILAPRSMGLFARAAGIPTLSIGDGSEMRAATDQALFNTRFGGYGSWRRLLDEHVAPLLGDHLDRAQKLVEHWAPDAVVVHPLAVFGALIARRLDIPHASLHLYPQLSPIGRPRQPKSYGGRLARHLSALYENELAAVGVLEVGWSELTLSVHDPALVKRTMLNKLAIGEPCGFPYWDDTTLSDADQILIDGARGSKGRLVVATMGSFIGHSQRAFWNNVATGVREAGCAGLFLNVPEALRATVSDREITCAGFVPLSRVAESADVIVHHGGIGTMYAALLSGRPSVVVPQAFDQAFNASLLEAASVGVHVRSGAPLGSSIRCALELADSGSPAELQNDLIPPKLAASGLAGRLSAWSELSRAD